jgi:hypothetical protein
MHGHRLGELGLAHAEGPFMGRVAEAAIMRPSLARR